MSAADEASVSITTGVSIFVGATNQRGQRLTPVWCGSHSSSQPTFKGAYCSKVVGDTKDRKVPMLLIINNQTMPSLGEDLTIAQLAAIGVEKFIPKARVGEEGCAKTAAAPTL
jgi:hypothetical protein